LIGKLITAFVVENAEAYSWIKEKIETFNWESLPCYSCWSLGFNCWGYPNWLGCFGSPSAEVEIVFVVAGSSLEMRSFGDIAAWIEVVGFVRPIGEFFGLSWKVWEGICSLLTFCLKWRRFYDIGIHIQICLL